VAKGDGERIAFAFRWRPKNLAAPELPPPLPTNELIFFDKCSEISLSLLGALGETNS
jgi:hypothetical protein